MSGDVSIQDAKVALDNLISISRAHFYKPIQIAEILYRYRKQADNSINLENKETYRIQSRYWRDDITQQLLGRISTSSIKYQDDVFNDTAIPPAILSVLGEYNNKNRGLVEVYIYIAFHNKLQQIRGGLSYCVDHDESSFDLITFYNLFNQQAGLKRSIDKIFEIIVYSLFEVLVGTIAIKVDVHFDPSKKEIVQEFKGFASKVLNLNPDQARKTLEGHFYRVGVTNAADRGLDMFANFGSVVQVKHLALDVDLAENIVSSITAENIIIVCKSVEENVIMSLLNQMGWHSRIQSIICIDELSDWYEKALRGKYSDLLGHNVMIALRNGIIAEFPFLAPSGFLEQLFQERGYGKVNPSILLHSW